MEGGRLTQHVGEALLQAVDDELGRERGENHAEKPRDRRFDLVAYKLISGPAASKVAIVIRMTMVMAASTIATGNVLRAGDPQHRTRDRARGR